MRKAKPGTQAGNPEAGTEAKTMEEMIFPRDMVPAQSDGGNFLVEVLCSQVILGCVKLTAEKLTMI